MGLKLAVVHELTGILASAVGRRSEAGYHGSTATGKFRASNASDMEQEWLERLVGQYRARNGACDLCNGWPDRPVTQLGLARGCGADAGGLTWGSTSSNGGHHLWSAWRGIWPLQPRLCAAESSLWTAD